MTDIRCLSTDGKYAVSQISMSIQIRECEESFTGNYLHRILEIAVKPETPRELRKFVLFQNLFPMYATFGMQKMANMLIQHNSSTGQEVKNKLSSQDEQKRREGLVKFFGIWMKIINDTYPLLNPPTSETSTLAAANAQIYVPPEQKYLLWLTWHFIGLECKMLRFPVPKDTPLSAKLCELQHVLKIDNTLWKSKLKFATSVLQIVALETEPQNVFWRWLMMRVQNSIDQMTSADTFDAKSDDDSDLSDNNDEVEGEGEDPEYDDSKWKDEFRDNNNDDDDDDDDGEGEDEDEDEDDNGENEDKDEEDTVESLLSAPRSYVTKENRDSSGKVRSTGIEPLFDGVSLGDNKMTDSKKMMDNSKKMIDGKQMTDDVKQPNTGNSDNERQFIRVKRMIKTNDNKSNNSGGGGSNGASIGSSNGSGAFSGSGNSNNSSTNTNKQPASVSTGVPISSTSTVNKVGVPISSAGVLDDKEMVRISKSYNCPQPYYMFVQKDLRQLIGPTVGSFESTNMTNHIIQYNPITKKWTDFKQIVPSS